MDRKKLIEEAKRARSLSYSPYSKFKVGAALLTKDGKTYLGANIENSAYSLCMCAERNAIYLAYLDGKRKEDMAALAVIGDTELPISPCGACRQVMAELLEADTPVFLANLKGEIKETSVQELLPYCFTGDDLPL